MKSTSSTRAGSCAVRGGEGKAKARGKLPPIDPRFTTGEYFMEPVRAWFGSDWQPATDWGGNAVVFSERARDARALRVKAGDTGSIPGLSKRSDARLAAATIARARGSSSR